jgi:uncharacterized OB-fold protein
MSENLIATADWTTGTEAILYQSCAACRAIWYFRRDFCPSCGSVSPHTHRAGGRGVVFAITIVCRAAMPEAKAHVPYAVLLVDAAEGFRLMAHGDNDLKIGDAVRAEFADFAGGLIPYFRKVSQH